MELITKAQTEQLLTNGRAQRAAIDQDTGALDFEPVVKLFTPDAQCTWLLTEIDGDGLAFGLCDLGLGCPELGYVSLTELCTVRGKLGLTNRTRSTLRSRQTDLRLRQPSAYAWIHRHLTVTSGASKSRRPIALSEACSPLH